MPCITDRVRPYCREERISSHQICLPRQANTTTIAAEEKAASETTLTLHQTRFSSHPEITCLDLLFKHSLYYLSSHYCAKSALLVLLRVNRPTLYSHTSASRRLLLIQEPPRKDTDRDCSHPHLVALKLQHLSERKYTKVEKQSVCSYNTPPNNLFAYKSKTLPSNQPQQHKRSVTQHQQRRICQEKPASTRPISTTSSRSSSSQQNRPIKAGRVFAAAHSGKSEKQKAASSCDHRSGSSTVLNTQPRSSISTSSKTRQRSVNSDRAEWSTSRIRCSAPDFETVGAARHSRRQSQHPTGKYFLTYCISIIQIFCSLPCNSWYRWLWAAGWVQTLQKKMASG